MLYFVIRAISNLFDLYSIALIVYALLSWFPGAYDTALGKTIRQIVQPILAPFRRLNLVFAGIDFSIIAIILLLNFSLSILKVVLF